MRTIIAIAALSLAAACGQTTTVEDTPDTTVVETPAPAPPTIVVLTEQDARTRAETAGYTAISGLTQNADGTWTATGTQNGATTSITISDTGVTAATVPTP
jgi:uncharacterized lipoprotein YajG